MRSSRKAQAERGGFAEIFRMIKNFYLIVMEVVQKFARAVARGVIDHDHFGIEAAIEHPIDNFADGFDFVKNRYHDGYFDPISHQPRTGPCAIIAERV